MIIINYAGYRGGQKNRNIFKMWNVKSKRSLIIYWFINYSTLICEIKTKIIFFEICLKGNEIKFEIIEFLFPFRSPLIFFIENECSFFEQKNF